MGPACTTDTTVCHCVAKAMDDCSIVVDAAMTQGTQVCHYGPQAQVLAVFDRILDGDLLDGGDGGPRPDIVSFSSAPAFAAVSTSTSYAPNGSPVALIFNLFANPPGPSLLTSVDPAMPANDTKVSFQLSSTRVLAKDGKTAFKGEGKLQDGTITFLTNAFSASITVPMAPPPPPPDAGTDMDSGVDAELPDASLPDVGVGVDALAEAGAPACVPPPPGPAPLDVPPGKDPVTIAFNNPVDASTIGSHVSVTVNGVPLAATAYTLDTTMAPTLTLTPMASWPASSTIVITVDATASDVLGDQLGAAASGSFKTTSGT
jgi:hypothetical protein